MWLASYHNDVTGATASHYYHHVTLRPRTRGGDACRLRCGAAIQCNMLAPAFYGHQLPRALAGAAAPAPPCVACMRRGQTLATHAPPAVRYVYAYDACHVHVRVCHTPTCVHDGATLLSDVRHIVGARVPHAPSRFDRHSRSRTTHARSAV